MYKPTLASVVASPLLTLSSAVMARTSTSQPLWVGTDVAQLAKQVSVHWVSVA